MPIYDPFGLIADYHIPHKILVQNTRSYGKNWDKAIPTELHELCQMHHFKIPRVYCPN